MCMDLKATLSSVKQIKFEEFEDNVYYSQPSVVFVLLCRNIQSRERDAKHAPLKNILDARRSLGFSTLFFSIQLGLLVKLYYQSPLALLIAGCLKLSIALMIMKFEQ